MPSLTLLKIKNLNISDLNGTSLIKNLNLDVRKGILNVIIGESGAGKSLTARALLNYLPKGLDMSFTEYQFENNEARDIKKFLGKDIGYISQNYAQSFNEHIRLEKQLIAIYRTHHDASRFEALEKIKNALKWVNLDDSNIIKKYSFELSGGQLERVYIASVLMLDPKLIIADEPVASLDVVNGHKIMQLLQHIVKDHRNTVLLITHNMNHVLRYGDYFTVMKRGEVVETGKVGNLLENRVSHSYTKQLLENRNTLSQREINE